MKLSTARAARFASSSTLQSPIKRWGEQNTCFRQDGLVKMYYFALDSGMGMSYSRAALKGGASKFFENEQIAIGKWQLSKNLCAPLPIIRIAQLYAKSGAGTEVYANLGWIGITPSEVHAKLG